MFQFLAKSIVDFAMGVPQSVLSIRARSKLEILQYEIFACGAVSLSVRGAFLGCTKYVLSQEMGNVRKCTVFFGQVDLQIFVCSSSQSARCELL